MANFAPSFDKTGLAEGGHVFVESDNGLETINGISRKYHPDSKVWKYVDTVASQFNIDNSKPMTKAESKLIDKALAKLPQFHEAVYEFYKMNFWDVMHLDLIESQAIAEELYDTGINQGHKFAALYLQKSLNLLNNNGSRYRDISIDGDIGANTLAAYNAYMKYGVSRYGYSLTETSLLKCLNGFQFMRYVDIVNRSPKQEINFVGWIKRV